MADEDPSDPPVWPYTRLQWRQPTVTLRILDVDATTCWR